MTTEVEIQKLKLEIEELKDMIATLDQENKQLNARNQRLTNELGQEYLGCKPQAY